MPGVMAKFFKADWRNEAHPLVSLSACFINETFRFEVWRPLTLPLYVLVHFERLSAASACMIAGDVAEDRDHGQNDSTEGSG